MTPEELNEHPLYAGPTGPGRKDTDATQELLPLDNPLVSPKVGTAAGEDSSRRNIDPQGHLERPARLLRGQLPEGEKARRALEHQNRMLAYEERTCAVKDTAALSDLCTCGHTRREHVPWRRGGTLRTHRCTLCICDHFTKESLTVWDELRERRTP